jgi:hypothetical protein
MSVGCAGDFDCASGIFQTGPACIQPCNVTSDCVNVETKCSPNGISTGQGGCVPNTCSTPFMTCDSEGTSDGTCYPISVSSSDGGLCLQGGTVANYQPCEAGRGDGGTGDLCMTGSACAVFTLGTLHPSACFTACAPNGTPGCDAGFFCAPITESHGLKASDFGACLPMCTTSCPSPLSCLNFGAPWGMLCAPT